LSGPCTLEYLLLKGAVLGARAVLRSASAVRDGVSAAGRAAEEALARRRQEARQRDEQRVAAMRRAEALRSGGPVSVAADPLPAPGLVQSADGPVRAASPAEAPAAPGASADAQPRLDELLEGNRGAQRSAALNQLRQRALDEGLALLAAAGVNPAAAPEIEVVMEGLARADSEGRVDGLRLELRRLIAARRGADSGSVAAPAHAPGAALDDEDAEAVPRAAAEILERTLEDLGFAVEPIAHTLFVEGGVAHFTRAEWRGYAVRLRASPADGTLNFNVVREAATVDDPQSQRIRDARTEEDWCAHIPRLTRTLGQRGIQLKVARMLGAGEAPVQEVTAGSLPQLLGDPAADAAAAASRDAQGTAEPDASSDPAGDGTAR
jgi:hypothetical protein